MHADIPASPPDAPSLPFEPAPCNGHRAALSADRLFQGSPEILIDHQGEIYRLRITKNGKLILTK
jgi:hemin uptake protein HemP